MAPFARPTIAALLAAVAATTAAAEDVDWRMYGGASVGEPAYCFYDQKSAERSASGIVRVWTKCLGRDETEILLDDSGAAAVATKVRSGYVPPAVALGLVGRDRLIAVVVVEQLADQGTIQPQSQIFEEINCKTRMDRTLSVSVRLNGQFGFDRKPSAWDYVPPEGNAARLLKLLCPPI